MSSNPQAPQRHRPRMVCITSSLMASESSALAMDAKAFHQGDWSAASDLKWSETLDDFVHAGLEVGHPERPLEAGQRRRIGPHGLVVGDAPPLGHYRGLGAIQAPMQPRREEPVHCGRSKLKSRGDLGSTGTFEL
jgi:hypothetical protein